MNDDKNLEDIELEILRNAVDKAQENKGKQKIRSPEIKNIIHIVEDFLRRKQLICYGGTAINNILPEKDQFYNKDVELPDYDFFSPNALIDAKNLADIYINKGYEDVEAKTSIHQGTYKIYVNFIPVADITQLTSNLFKAISKDAIKVNGIKYAPPNFLRMGMYLELSRPKGDVSRWEKVLKRLILLNKNYPLKNQNCKEIDFQREFKDNSNKRKKVYYIVRNSIIDQGLILFGGFASSMYARYMPAHKRRQIAAIPDFDVLSKNPQKSAAIIKDTLQKKGIKNVTIYKQPPIGELIGTHYEVVVGEDTVCFIYEPIACYSYNIINIDNKKIRIATIDTMLSFYLAFIYANRLYYDKERIICMAQYLFEVQENNRLQQKGLLRRFTINCYGKQETLEEIRANKARLFRQLKTNPESKMYQKYFLRYVPLNKTKKRKIRNTRRKREKEIKKISFDPTKTRKILNIEY